MNTLANAAVTTFHSLRLRPARVLLAVIVLIAGGLLLVSRSYRESRIERFMDYSLHSVATQTELRSRAAEQAAKEKPSLAALEQSRISSELETSPAAPTPPPPSQVGQPMIARSGEMQVLVKNLPDGRAAVEAVITRHHGYMAELHVEGDSGGRSLTATARVPADEFAGALQELKSVGQVEKESQSSEDVSQPYQDLSARLHNAQETEARLQDVLQHRAGKMSDILEVEQEISRVRGEIEGMQAELRNLNRRISYSTISLDVREQYSAQFTGAAPALKTQLRNATVRGLREAWLSLLGIILFAVGYGPALLLWAAILFFPARFLFRKWRKANWQAALSPKVVSQDAK